MAKGKYEKWITEEGLIRVRGWALDGLTDEQIAHNMGINVATFYRWKERFCEIRDALKETKEIADRAVENALYKAACEGNTTAMIFWLKNRKPSVWREKQQDETADRQITVTINAGDGYAD